MSSVQERDEQGDRKEWAKVWRYSAANGGLSAVIQGQQVPCCSDWSDDLMVLFGRALPAPAPGRGTDPGTLNAMKAVAASIHSASSVDLVAACVLVLQAVDKLLAGLLSTAEEEEAGE
ncbi:hypothetical protein CLOM_g23949 [Closterium sp. NIES-68]|nr:hypothetical protein CLOM_g23949 [Closterium sp. NIES-68]GJP83967.1 hypothetical protein CLOP_g14066 [Closterium sp. NIES-67]